jgi:2-polyprenyl-3-methyl-5-hydroxy-6-metoxy-1,4-benzoquinol methylase
MNEEVYLRHAKSFKNHWWFKSRVLIFDTLLKNLNLKKNIQILDYGSGVGSNLSLLKRLGNVHALEPHTPAAIILKKKFKVKVIYKIKEKYDLIFLTDVIEHVKNDKKKINELISCLKKNGYLVLTAPAFQFLFSKKDETLHHYRRYNANNLVKLFSKKKIEITKLTYFNFILFFPIVISILFFKLFKINFINSVEKTPFSLINYYMFKIFSFERYILKYFNLNFGLSLLLIVKKVNK